MSTRADLAAIYAGGEGRRMGGVDKGALELGGRPLWRIVLEQLGPQTKAIAVLAPRRPTWLDGFRLEGVPDVMWIEDDPAIEGPAAGLIAALVVLEREVGPGGLLLTVPVDAPFVPGDLFRCLNEARGKTGANVVLASTSGRPHPVFGLWTAGSAAELAELATKDGALWRLAVRAGLAMCEAWEGRSPDPFTNLNTLADLAAAEAMLAAG
jgi:molybdenum cofactor guanylyltransferase